MRYWDGWLRPLSSGAYYYAGVEVQKGEDDMIRLRSSMSPYGVAIMKESEFRSFIEAVKEGEYDHLCATEKPYHIQCQNCPGMAYLHLDNTYKCDHCMSKQEQQILSEGYHGL